MPRPKPRSSFRTAADRDDARELPPLQPEAVSLLVQTRCHRRRNGVFGPTKTTTGLLARIAVVAVAVSSLAAGRAFERTIAAPHVSPVPYRLIQEPDAGYQPIIDLIRSAVSSVRMTTDELAEDDAVTALADAHRRGVDVKVILDTAFHGLDTNQAAYDALHAAGVDIKWAPNDAIYHQKPIVVDHTIAAVGTGNLTKKYYATSPDAYILTTSTSDVAAIAATFDADFTDEHLAGAKLSARSGIASAGVRSTSRPSSVPTRPARPTAYASVGVAGTDAVFSTSRVAPDDRLAGAQDATCPESPCYRPAYPIRALTKPDSLVCLYLVVAMKKCLPRTRRTPSVAHRGYCPGIIG